MKGKIYIETSFISYLTSKPSKNIILQAQQEISKIWWSEEKLKYEIFISSLVVEEASKGDKNASNQRLENLKGIPLLKINNEVKILTQKILTSKVLDKKAIADIIHISVATVHCIDFLLTWNCKHIANANIIKVLSIILEDNNYNLPIICTPYELF